ncbi:unnamed protein product [marine sediment metagenome]|uniref:Uncharacterized protein n=1 Tax=marine sediment metagenome TaxID=412755 RepID=X1SB81_9ZZZZ
MAGNAGIAILGLVVLYMLGQKRPANGLNGDGEVYFDLSIAYPEYVPSRGAPLPVHAPSRHKVTTTPAQVMEMVTARHVRTRPGRISRMVERGFTEEQAEYTTGISELRSRLLWAKGPIIP